MDIIIVLGLVGSIASVVGVYLAAPNPRSRIIHAIYGFIFVVLSGYLVYYYQRDSEVAKLESGIERLFQAHSMVAKMKGVSCWLRWLFWKSTKTASLKPSRLPNNCA